MRRYVITQVKVLRMVEVERRDRRLTNPEVHDVLAAPMGIGA